MVKRWTGMDETRFKGMDGVTLVVKILRVAKAKNLKNGDANDNRGVLPSWWFSQHTIVAYSMDRRQFCSHAKTRNGTYKPRNYKKDTTFRSRSISTSMRVRFGFYGRDDDGSGTWREWLAFRCFYAEPGVTVKRTTAINATFFPCAAVNHTRGSYVKHGHVYYIYTYTRRKIHRHDTNSAIGLGRVPSIFDYLSAVWFHHLVFCARERTTRGRRRPAVFVDGRRRKKERKKGF